MLKKSSQTTDFQPDSQLKSLIVIAESLFVDLPTSHALHSLIKLLKQTLNIERTLGEIIFENVEIKTNSVWAH